MDGCTVQEVPLCWAVMSPLQLGQTGKTFLTGQRANIPFPVIRRDGIGGARRGRGVWGLRKGGILFRLLAQLRLCPRLSSFSTHPVLLHLHSLGKISRVLLKGSGNVGIQFLPSAAS